MSQQVYGLVDPRDGRLRYIGISQNPERRLRDHEKDPEADQSGLSAAYGWINHLQRLGHEPDLVILDPDPGRAEEVEQKLIKLLGRDGHLLNRKHNPDPAPAPRLSEANNRSLTAEDAEVLRQRAEDLRELADELDAEARGSGEARHDEFEEGGLFDIDLVTTGRSDEDERLQVMTEIVREQAAADPDGAPLQEVLAEAERRDIDVDEARSLLQQLKEYGEIYVPKTDYLDVVRPKETQGNGSGDGPPSEGGDDQGQPSQEGDSGETGAKEQMRDIVKELAEDDLEGASLPSILIEATERGLGDKEAMDLLQEMKERGEIYSPAKDHYDVVRS